jgi:uncharacterized protein YndB with AHSA1/START domain
VHLSKSIDIAAPPERVFAWLQPGRQARWDPSLVRALALAGARFERVVRTQGHRFLSEAEATEVEADRRFAWRQVAGDFAEHRGAFDLEPVPGGTRLRVVEDVEYPYRMPSLVTEEDLRRELSASLDEALFNLKRLAESPGAA